MKKKQIDAILSDYDGTLCSTTSVRNGVGPVGTIPQGLEQLLFHISENIPVCIISSKDFAFLHGRARFARILSCVLGTETVIHKPHYRYETENYGCIKFQVITSSNSLMDNSKLLNNVVEALQNHDYKDILIEKKYTSNKEILIGLTIDYRHLHNWQSFKENEEPELKEIIQKAINANIASNLPNGDLPLIQKYSSHPFLDVYGVECNKGLAFDSVLSHLEEKKERGTTNVIYLGDSENDNPAFRKSDISIGICSDTRLNPVLDCKHMLDFKQLPIFLRRLMDNKYIFSEELLPHVD
jgi:HAD superfamily hydrolase (TIGR01484 family)